MQVSEAIKKIHKEVLYPCVRVKTKDAGGSGTILFSGENTKGEFETYILTNHHVISGAIDVKKRWVSRLGREIKVESRSTVYVEQFRYKYWSHYIGQEAIEADIVAYESSPEDLALLKLRSINKSEHVAHVVNPDLINQVWIRDEIIAVGAQLSLPPIPTEGHICHMDEEIDNRKYILGDYPSIYGSSGGAVFKYYDDLDKYVFIGVPSRVTVIGSIFSVDTITHLSWFIGPDRVVKFLEDHDYQFIYDPSVSIEECQKNRERKKSEAQKVLERQYGIVEEIEEESASN